MAFVKLADNYTDLIGKFAVALLAEGVDRNQYDVAESVRAAKSPSSRRAWIEINTTESGGGADIESPSSRRAWIEIPRLCSRWR